MALGLKHNSVITNTHGDVMVIQDDPAGYANLAVTLLGAQGPANIPMDRVSLMKLGREIMAAMVELDNLS